MIDSAFFDRFHYYIPGWEIPKMKPEFFTDQYGFISDYLAEWLREMRKRSFSDAIFKYFKLGKELNQRDVIAVKHTVSGLLKILFPNGEFSKEDVKKVLEYALVGRRRVKEQLKKIGGMEFYNVHFSYIDIEDNEETFVGVPELGGSSIIPEGELPAGTVFTIASGESGHKTLFKIDLQKMAGNGKFNFTGFGGGNKIRDELKEAINFFKANLSQITEMAKYSEYDFHIKGTDLSGIGNIYGIELAIFISLVSGLMEKSIIPQSVVLGSMSIGGTIIATDNLPDALQVASDSGAKKVILPAGDMAKLGSVPTDLMGKFSFIVYSSPIDAVFKALGVE
jgi:ATP-dependent Lon protease